MTSWDIHDARPEQLQAVSDLLRAAYGEYHQSFEPKHLWAEVMQEITDVWRRQGRCELIVAESGGKIEGTVSFYPDASLSEHPGWPKGWGELRLLAVSPSLRGSGLGRLLTNECIRRARARNIPTLGLHTTRWMAIAKGMYERMGFVRAPEYDFFPAPGVTVMAYKMDL